MWPNPEFPADLVTFTEEILMESFSFCAVSITISIEVSRENLLFKTSWNLKIPISEKL